MAVRVVARQCAVVEPQHAVHAEVLLQAEFHLPFVVLRIAVGIEQTGRSSQQGAEAIAFDAAPFQLKVKAVHVVAPQDARIVHLAIDGVVQRGLKLASPTIEAVVQQLDARRV